MLRFRALCFICASTVLCCIGAVVFAQQAPASPNFEIASVKQNRSGDNTRRFGMPANRFEATNLPLRRLIEVAYGESGPPPRTLFDYQVSGGSTGSTPTISTSWRKQV